MSRNAREGRYIGKWEHKHVRTLRPHFLGMGLCADIAWACMSKRVGWQLPLRRPPYLVKSGRIRP